MALTPEEVVNQKFTITKFRDGYDLDQVDDFLDTIVEEIRQHEQAKNDLQAQLDAANARVAQLEAQLAEAQGGAPAPKPAEQTIVVDAAQPGAPKAAEATAGDSAAVKSSAMLQLALELHDKYINEAEVARDEIVREAEKTASQLVEDAQKQRSDELRRLEVERKDLSDQIRDLREFESEYRSTLSSYIQSQLRDLEGSPEPKGAPKNLD